jgi:isopentenyl-diphosphate delta-isomerase
MFRTRTVDTPGPGPFNARMPARLIRVDDRDRVIGTASKRACHTGRGLRHRAYLVMLLNRRGELLLARRHPSKWLWPGWWDGTVAGHVEAGETYAAAARRRVFEEMGVRPRLRRVDTFAYTARYRGDGENEICAVFVGTVARVRPNPREVDAWKFDRSPRGRLVPWLRIALRRIKAKARRTRKKKA